MFLSISSTHIIISAIILILLMFGGIYGFYRLIKYAVKKGIKESIEK